jgi:uncharacterized protein (TIGR03083 family)
LRGYDDLRPSQRGAAHHKTVDRIDAAWRERAEVLTLCRELDDDEWQKPSAAEGWCVQDVVAHMGSVCHALFTPAATKILRSSQIERTNDDFVDDRRTWTPTQTLAEYERWSGRGIKVVSWVSRTPLARMRIPVGELGRYPVGQIAGAVVFDTHIHLRHDMTPALDRPAPATDDNRMAVVTDWMMAVLSNQLRFDQPHWRDRAVMLTLIGPGGGTWSFGPDGTLQLGRDSSAAAEITGTASEFPEWGTKRAEWRDRDVTIGGDEDYGVRFLDEMNIV